MSCTKIQSNIETFCMPNWHEVTYINLKFPSHTQSHTEACRFLHYFAKSYTFQDLLLNTPRDILIFVWDLVSRCWSSAQCSPEFPKQIIWAKPHPKPIRQKTYFESTLNHQIQPNPQKLQPLSLTDVTRESCFALLVQWLSHKHPQKERLKAQVSPTQPAFALILDELLIPLSPWDFLVGYLSIWCPASIGMLMDDLQGNVKGWWRQLPNSRKHRWF